MLETSARLLRVLSLLQSRPEWSGAALAQRLEVSTRTVRHDVERLRELGYEISSTPGVAGGYRLGSGTALPPLLLDDDEAVAVGVGLRVAASGTVSGLEETSLRALAKLEQMLPSRLRPRIEALRYATISAVQSGPTVNADTLAILAAACQRHEQLRFDYRRPDGDSAQRTVEPHRLVYAGQKWYLLAWDRDREDWRTFRADRITPRLPTGPRFSPREPPDEAARHVVRGIGSLGWRHPARVRLLVPAARVAAEIDPASGLLQEIDAESCLLETGSDTLQHLVGYLTGLGVPFEVLDPPQLRTLLLESAARLSHAAGTARS